MSCFSVFVSAPHPTRGYLERNLVAKFPMDISCERPFFGGIREWPLTRIDGAPGFMGPCRAATHRTIVGGLRFFPMSPRAAGGMDDTSIRGVFRCVLASTCHVWSVPVLASGSPTPLAPGPLLLPPPVVSLVAFFCVPALTTEDSASRGPGCANTRHWSWIPRPGGPPSLPPIVCIWGR